MSIPMAIPEQFLPAVISGKVVRFGCILKEVVTGRIVGHLKESTGLAQLLSSIPIQPLSAATTIVAQAGQWIDTRMQLRQIRQTLDHLQLVSSVGAVVSVAGLGVSVAGFAVVLRRLNRLEQNLNQGMDRMRAEVEKVRLTLDLLQMAELRDAWELLGTADQTNRPGRSADLLQEADKTFRKYRHYYYCLITELQPWTRAELSLPQLRELYGRYFACVLAELEANFLLRDFAHWHRRHELICGQLRIVCGFDTREEFRVRASQLGFLTTKEMQDLQDQAALTRDFCKENRDRIETAAEEVMWLERRGITPAEYLQTLRTVSEEGIMLLPHDE